MYQKSFLKFKEYDNEITSGLPDYNDIFGDNPQEIAKIGRQLKTKHDKLKKIVNDTPDDPAASAAASTVISDDNCNSCFGNN